MVKELDDLTLRLEKEFALSLQNAWQASSGLTMQVSDLTAGQLHEHVCGLLRENGREVPHSSWHRVKRCIARALRIPASQIQPDSRLGGERD